MQLITLQPTHYAELYDICSKVDVWVQRTPREHIDFLSKCFGWVLEHKNNVVGYVILMNHVPYLDIAVHCSVLPEYRSRWLTKSIYKTVFNTIFDNLLLPRCSSWIIDGYSNPTFLSRLGFKKEGVTRNGFIVGTRWCDVHNYGMLPDERRWK